MSGTTRAGWGGLALLLGVLAFIGSRFRDHVDASDRLLAVFMTVAPVGIPAGAGQQGGRAPWT